MYEGFFRRWVFWLLDRMKGHPIGNHYRDIKEMLEDQKAAQSRRDAYLQKLLVHSTEAVDYYKPFSSFSKLSDFPVINKSIIKENPDHFISAIHRGEKLYYARTSGSTGAPFTYVQDMNKRHRVLASLIYFGQRCGFEIGMRNIYFGAWLPEDRKTKWNSFKQNMIVVDVINLSDDHLEKMRITLKRNKKIRCVLGYASTLDRLAKFLLDKGDEPVMFGIKTIISSAEKLNESTRENLKKVFGCDVISRYSNTENGILAQECTSKLEFHINNADFIFEILKMDSDESVATGEMGRIVVTDLFNYAMPLIRYDTGDIGVLAEEHQCEWKTPVFERIDGRRLDFLYTTKGEPISPIWDFDIESFKDIKQFQFIQESEKEYLLKVNGAKGLYPDDVLINKMKETLGEDAKVVVVHVDDIPISSSGKFKQNINNYIKK